MTSGIDYPGLDRILRSEQPGTPMASDGQLSLGLPQPSRSQLVIGTILAWTAIGAFQSIPELIYLPQWNIFFAKMVDAWTWATLTPAVLFSDRYFISFKLNAKTIIFRIIVLSIAFSLFHTLLIGIILYPWSSIFWNPLRDHQFIVYFFLGSWITYCAMMAAIQALKFYNRLLTSQIRLKQTEKKLVESHLNILRLQLEPHFLFNTLNAISSEVGPNPSLARDMIQDLSVLLRSSLASKESGEITLAREITLLEHYIAIQKIRYGDRLRINLVIDPDVLTNLVPSLLLQPLVENAVRHGIDDRISGGTITVSAYRQGNDLEIRVCDDGSGLSADWQTKATTGIGVRSTRERLEALYPGSPGLFAAQARTGGGTEMIIRIPTSQSPEAPA